MKDRSLPSGGTAPRLRRRHARGYWPAAVTFATVMGAAHFSGFLDTGATSNSTRASLGEVPPLPTLSRARPTVASVDLQRMLAPSLSARSEDLKLRQDIDQNAAADAGFQTASVPSPATPAVAPAVQQAGIAPLPPSIETAQVVPDAPLPTPRPADLKFSDPARTASKQVPLQPVPSPVSRVAKAMPDSAPPTADNRSFFEKFFNVQQTPTTALAYASPNDGMDLAPSRRLAPAPNQSIAALTAIYDISAGVVHMPSGEKLEAHSGLGDKFDDTSAVHIRMRGPTPPGTYDLKEREALFHGVRALRMNPVGGSGAIYGRSGILAHTYMLGPRGDSNGCISFKNYDRFLQAYLRGEVKRIVVVARRGDPVPSIASTGRTARNGSGA